MGRISPTGNAEVTSINASKPAVIFLSFALFTIKSSLSKQKSQTEPYAFQHTALFGVVFVFFPKERSFSMSVE